MTQQKSLLIAAVLALYCLTLCSTQYSGFGTGLALGLLSGGLSGYGYGGYGYGGYGYRGYGGYRRYGFGGYGGYPYGGAYFHRHRYGGIPHTHYYY